jgi:hypothetical protein
MFQNAILDVTIGLIFMYLVLSLLCTVVNEYIATWFKLRATTLKNGLAKLIDDTALKSTFDNHGVISGAKKAAGDDHPSYLSSKDFVTAIIDSLDPKNPVPGLAEIQAGINKLSVNSDFRDVLIANLTAAEGDINKFRQNLATWFDDVMERLSGVYKRYLKTISLIAGIALAVAMNADTLRVSKALWGDPSLRNQISSAAERYVKECKECTKPDGEVDWDKLKKGYQDAQTKLRPLPIGWPDTSEDSGARWLLLKLLGLLLTGFALSLGAPFWFDLLAKLVKLRGAGAKPEREDEKVAKGKPAVGDGARTVQLTLAPPQP